MKPFPNEPITIEELIASDSYEESIITAVRQNSDGYIDINFGGKGVLLESKIFKTMPKVGDALRLYSEGGMSCHGIAINRELVLWKTPLEREVESLTFRAKQDREFRVKYAEEREGMEKAMNELPPPLQARMRRYQEESADFWKYQAYELFICTQTAWLMGYLESIGITPETPYDLARAALGQFQMLVTSEQMNLGMEAGHSGNTFNTMIGLADRLLRGVEV